MKKSRITLRQFSNRSFSLVTFLLLTNTKAQAAVLMPGFVVAQAAGLSAAFGFVLTIIIIIGFIMGVAQVIEGWRSIDRGSEGKLKILGGVGIALAVPIMRFIYGKVMPGTIDNIQAGSLD